MLPMTNRQKYPIELKTTHYGVDDLPQQHTKCYYLRAPAPKD
jgi:hypothetical protein